MLYGFMVVAGVIVATWFISRLTKKIDPWEMLSYVLIGGLIGARLYHVLNFWSDYSQNPLQIFYLWQGGLGIFGGFLGGIGGLFIYSRISHISLIPLIDLTATGLPLAQAIGRFGNFFNQELYGKPTNLPWAIYISPEKRLPEVANFTHFHPLFLYESLGCFLIFISLITLIPLIKKSPQPHLDGRLFFAYIAMYGLLRFLLEPLRIESWIISNINVTQAVSGLLILVGIVGLVRSWHFRSLKLDKEVRN